MMTAQELLQNSLSNLLTLQDSSFLLSFHQAMDLDNALARINDILTALEKEGKDWEAESLSKFLKTKDERLKRMKDILAELEKFNPADMIIEACHQ